MVRILDVDELIDELKELTNTLMKTPTKAEIFDHKLDGKYCGCGTWPCANEDTKPFDPKHTGLGLGMEKPPQTNQ